MIYTFLLTGLGGGVGSTYSSSELSSLGLSVITNLVTDCMEVGIRVPVQGSTSAVSIGEASSALPAGVISIALSAGVISIALPAGV